MRTASQGVRLSLLLSLSQSLSKSLSLSHLSTVAARSIRGTAAKQLRAFAPDPANLARDAIRGTGAARVAGRGATDRFPRGVSPNPFPAGNGPAEIAFELARAGAVSFEVFDATGRLVASPVRMRTAISERRTRLVVVR